MKQLYLKSERFIHIIFNVRPLVLFWLVPTKVSVVLRKIFLRRPSLSAVLTSDNWQDHRQEECQVKKTRGTIFLSSIVGRSNSDHTSRYFLRYFSALLRAIWSCNDPDLPSAMIRSREQHTRGADPTTNL